MDVPLASTFILSSKEGKEAYVQPVVEGDRYRFTVKMGTPPAEREERHKAGARGKLSLPDVRTLQSTGDYIKAEGKAGRMGARLMAIVAEGARGRVYLAANCRAWKLSR